MEKILKSKGYNWINRVFDGEVNLSLELTHYSRYSVTTNIDVTLKENPIIGGSAEMRMVADGSHTPVFSSDFVKSTGSEDYDTTLNVINKVVFYFDGEQAFYSITVLA